VLFVWPEVPFSCVLSREHMEKELAEGDAFRAFKQQAGRVEAQLAQLGFTVSSRVTTEASIRLKAKEQTIRQLGYEESWRGVIIVCADERIIAVPHPAADDSILAQAGRCGRFKS
jgi:hypothetical protein